MDHPRIGVWMVVAIGLAAALTGCVSSSQGGSYTTPYKRVDRTSSDYQAAVAAATDAALANGKSPRTASREANKSVTAQFIAREKNSRHERVAPLVAALDDLDRPRGCWAYTVTSTTTREGSVTVTVERFNPYEPEERLWTLLSRNGRVPTEEQQADYRRERLRKWKKQQERAAKGKSASVRARNNALRAEIDASAPDDAGHVTFTFEREAIHIALLGDSPRSHETYTIDPAFKRVLQHTMTHLAPASMLGIHIDAFASTADYQVILPELPPFPAKTVLHYRLRFFGKDTGNVTLEAVYSDYKKVKCYEDRFSVKLSEMTVLDVVP